MPKNSHTREEGERLFKEYVEEIRNETDHGAVLANDVFKRFENGEWITLAETEKFHLSKIHSLGIFVEAGLIKKLSKINKTYYIEWCGGNAPIEDIVKIYKKTLKAHQKNNNVVKKVENKQIQKPVIPKYVNHIMSREEYKLVGDQPKEEDIENVHKIDLEVYIQRRNDPQPESKFFEILKENGNGALEITDVRRTINKEGKVINRQVVNCHYKQLGIISIKDDKLCYWTKGMIPTREMAKDICYEEIYKKYLYYETKKAKLANIKAIAIEARKAEEKKLIDEAELAEVTAEIEAEKIEKLKVVEEIKPNFHEKVFEISEETKSIDYDKFNKEELVVLTDRELLILIYQNQLKNRELLQDINKRIDNIETYQGNQSENLVTVADILRKSTV